MSKSYKMIIDGELIEGEEFFSVFNPATEEEVALVPKASHKQVEEAVESASLAQEEWGKNSQQEFRKKKLFECQRALRDYSEELAKLLTIEQGKPLKAAMGEVSGGIEEIAKTLEYGSYYEVLQDDAEKKVEMEIIPFGVVAAITPWNYPVFIALAKLVSSLWMGNTVVMKPSEFTPLTTLRMGEILKEILPKGVFNVVTGEGDVGEKLVCHSKVRMVSFTGSVPTGKKIAANCVEDLKRYTLELGGNDGALVLPGTSLEKIAKKLFWGAFINSGQICVAIKRLYVHKTQVDELAKLLSEMAEKVILGDGLDESTRIGPINNRIQFDKVVNFYHQAKESGAKLWSGGPLEGKGFFFRPCVVTGLQEGHPLVDEEQFGPILPLIAYDDVDDAVRRINAVSVGLAGSVWGNDVRQSYSVARKIHSGTVWVNTVHDTHPDACFGGVKQSGVGREGGREGLKSFGEIRVISQRK